MILFYLLTILRTFVAPEDYPKLLALMKMVKHDVLKNEFIVIVFYGKGNNGKTVMTNLLRKLATSTERVPARLFRRPSRANEINYIIATNASLVCVGEDGDRNLIEQIYEFKCDVKGQKIRKMYSSDTVEINPGVFLINTNSKPKPIYGNKVLILEFPNTFKFNPELSNETIIQQCLKEFETVC